LARTEKSLGATLKETFGGAVGNSIEWYDFAVFGFSAPITAHLFVSASNHLLSIFYVYLLFALGFISRPIGSFIFGYIGDKYGRTVTLKLTVWLMSVPTVLLGLMPTYATLGIATPIIIAFLRLMQGLAMGGEFTGSIIYLAESAPSNRRGLFASFGYMSTTAGILLGSAIVALNHHLFSMQQTLEWAWRLPFLFALLLGITAYFLRKNLPEPEFMKRREKPTYNPILLAFKQNKPSIFKTIGLNIFNAIGFYVFFIFMVTYFSTLLHFEMKFALLLNTLCLLILMLTIPIAGLISDIYSRKKILLIATTLLFILIVPAFSYFSNTHVWLSSLIMVVLTVLFGFIQGSLPVTFVDLFPPQTRASGLSISFNISNAIFGGTAPAVAMWLISFNGGKFYGLTAYLMIALLIFVLTTITLTQTGRRTDT